MNVTLSVLLAVLAIIAFWIIAGSKGKWFTKVTMITLFYLILALSYHSLDDLLGHPALDSDFPYDRKITIYGVKVVEPWAERKGGIYFMLKTPKEHQEKFMITVDPEDPMLFAMPYTKSMHEQVEREIRPQLRRTTAVRGIIKKEPKGEQSSSKGKQKGKQGARKGNANERDHSMRSEPRFYNLQETIRQAKPR